MPISSNAVAFPRPTATDRERDLIRARELSDSTILIAAVGEIDADTATGLSERIERYIGAYPQVIVDFSRLAFFGTAGYSVLNHLHARCARTGVDWVLVPGPEVARLLRVCDPDGILPTAPNIVSAVAALTRLPHRTPHLRAAGH